MLRFRSRSRASTRQPVSTRARDIIAKVGLAGFEHHRPSELSGGMRKRVSLARTLIYQPETLLLDEPFGALDAQTRVLMQKQLLDLYREFGLTVLLVTHDIGEAIALSDRIVAAVRAPGTDRRGAGRAARRRAATFSAASAATTISTRTSGTISPRRRPRPGQSDAHGPPIAPGAVEGCSPLRRRSCWRSVWSGSSRRTGCWRSCSGAGPRRSSRRP